MTACLGLDTSTPFLVIGLWSEDGGLLASRSERVERQHASLVIPTLDAVLDEAGIEKRAIKALAVGQGPGSYTGLKVAGAVGLGLARALGVPLSGVDTLAAMAANGLEEGEEGLSLIDARRGNVYCGRYRNSGGRIHTVAEPRKQARDEALSSAGEARIIEGVAPDPTYLSRMALSGENYTPSYL